MQDETEGYPIEEFVGLRAKRTEKWITQKLASAGVKDKLAKHLVHQRYLNILNGASEFLVKQTTIRAHDHRLYNVQQTRIALSAIGDKRYIIRAGSTRAHGHWRNRNFDPVEGLEMLVDDL